MVTYNKGYARIDHDGICSKPRTLKVNKSLRTKDLQASAENAEFDKLMYRISHDVRASTRALADIPLWIKEDLELAEMKLPKDVAESIELLIRHAKRLDQMMLDLLTYSRVGRAQDVAIINPAAVISKVVKPFVEQTGWKITCHLPDCSIKIGEQDITTLFHSLISNAIKHSDQATGTLDISGGIGNDAITILFQDDGPGIDDSFHKKIFEMMTTLRSRDAVEGSGLGLAIATKICETYGGGISVESSSTKRGSIFRVVLPLITRT